MSARNSRAQTKPLTSRNTRDVGCLYSYLILSALTLACLLPFSGRAFHIDDPLFVWTARQIVNHPLDPYGFRVVWSSSEKPMSALASNPPLASYYIALVGLIAGWSERALHLAFLIPALTVVLGTYRLARQFTTYPFVAAAATLLSPVFLVSAGGVMCDTTMLAFWILACIFWKEGLDSAKPIYLFVALFAVAACTLTKYFGAASIVLLLLYTFLRKKRLARLVWWLVLPIAILVTINIWLSSNTKDILLVSIARFAIRSQSAANLSFAAKAVVGLVFAGGCILPALTFIPVLFSRTLQVLGAVLCTLILISSSQHWLNLGQADQSRTFQVSLQAAIYVIGGLSILVLAARDLRQRYDSGIGRGWRGLDADSSWLFLWVTGTLLFAAFVNWTNNGRSILPATPAVGILIARQLEIRFAKSRKRFFVAATTMPLVVSGIISLWAASSDAAIANAQRQAAQWIYDHRKSSSSSIWFEGHWGFQYYMQSLGFRPLRVGDNVYKAGDYLVIPSNNTSLLKIPREVLGQMTVFSADSKLFLATQSPTMGAGFYSSIMGPLPFAFGEMPPERYLIFEIAHSFKISS